MPHTHARPFPPLLLFLLTLTLLPGCARDRADLDAAARFGAAASALAVTAEAELLNIRREALALRAERYALWPSASVAAADDRMTPQPPPPNPPLDAGLETPHAESRVAATRALAAFGTLLTLAAANVDTRDPAARVIEALRLQSLAGAGGLTDAQAVALADLADAVARHTLTARRAAAVRRALLETEVPLRQLAGALRADFDPEAPRWLANLANERTEAHLLRERLEAEALWSAASEKRLAAARALAQRAARADAEARQTADRLRAAVDAMLRAHETLLAELRDRHPITFEDIDAFLTEAERLKLTWQILRHD